MSTILNEVLLANREYSSNFDKDDAHVIRNAGGLIEAPSATEEGKAV